MAQGKGAGGDSSRSDPATGPSHPLLNPPPDLALEIDEEKRFSWYPTSCNIWPGFESYPPCPKCGERDFVKGFQKNVVTVWDRGNITVRHTRYAYYCLLCSMSNIKLKLS